MLTQECPYLWRDLAEAVNEAQRHRRGPTPVAPQASPQSPPEVGSSCAVVRDYPESRDASTQTKPPLRFCVETQTVSGGKRRTRGTQTTECHGDTKVTVERSTQTLGRYAQQSEQATQTWTSPPPVLVDSATQTGQERWVTARPYRSEPTTTVPVPAPATESRRRSPTPNVRSNGCWNCGGDHRYNRCPKPYSGNFCYRCGRRGVTLKTCDHCQAAWRREMGYPTPSTSSTRLPERLEEPDVEFYRPHRYYEC